MFQLQTNRKNEQLLPKNLAQNPHKQQQCQKFARPPANAGGRPICKQITFTQYNFYYYTRRKLPVTPSLHRKHNQPAHYDYKP